MHDTDIYQPPPTMVATYVLQYNCMSACICNHVAGKISGKCMTFGWNFWRDGWIANAGPRNAGLKFNNKRLMNALIAICRRIKRMACICDKRFIQYRRRSWWLNHMLRERITGLYIFYCIGVGRHFCPKIYAWKIIKMPKFYMIIARKINKIPEFYTIFARKK